MTSGIKCDRQAQTPPRPIRRSERYDDSFITERKAFKWPGNNTLAVWFAPNVEVWQYDSALKLKTDATRKIWVGRYFTRLFAHGRLRCKSQSRVMQGFARGTPIDQCPDIVKCL